MFRFLISAMAVVTFATPIASSSYANDGPSDGFPGPSLARAEIRSESQWSPPRNWETKVMGVTVKGTAQRRANDLRGVLHIYPPLSNRWTFHWTGRIEGNQVFASHSDGHVFQGAITPERIVVGTLTTREGHQFPVKAPLP